MARQNPLNEFGGGPSSSGGRGSGNRVSVSTRSSQLDSGTKRSVKSQNKAAESYKIKDMDKLEKGQKYRAELKMRKAEDQARLLKNAETKGKIKGAAATAGLGIAIAIEKAKEKGKGKGTQKGHKITDFSSHTKPIK